MSLNQQAVQEALSGITLPDNQKLLDSNLIDTVEIKGSTLTILFNPNNLDQADLSALQKNITNALTSFKEVERVEFKQSSADATMNIPRKPRSTSYLSSYDRVVLISSGKGGVGKSTCALNLALALRQKNKQVALLDADVYGPSMPMMFGLRGHKPQTENNLLQPLSKFGLEFISIGNFIEEGEAVAWRGPLVHQALEQLMRDTNFSGGDYMIIDMPPGTGDVQITLSQLTSAYGAIIVCTAQDVALIDARRAMAMFDKVNIPILGMIENMSDFCCPHCQQKIELFGEGKIDQECRNFKTKFLGKIDLDPQIVIGTDRARPIVHEEQDSKAKQQFLAIAENLIQLP